MRKIVLMLLVSVLSISQVNAKWWDWFGDFRIGVSAGANLPMGGDASFVFKDVSSLKFPTISGENFSYNSLSPNAGVYLGFEKMISKTFSYGVGFNLGYQKDGFSFDIKNAANTLEAECDVSLSSFYGLYSIYGAYYFAPKVSFNFGAGLFNEFSLGNCSVSISQTKGDNLKEDPEQGSKFNYFGLQGNLGFTYHITNHCFFTLTAYYDFIVSSGNGGNPSEESNNSGSGGGNSGGLNPGGGGGGFNPGGGGGGFNPGGGLKSATDTDLDQLNYVTNGLWIDREKFNRMTLLLTVGYRF